MSARTPQPLIDQIVKLLRTTDLSLVAIARECGTSPSSVKRYAKQIEAEFQRNAPPPHSPELQIAIVVDAVAGFKLAEIAGRNGVTREAVRWALKKHAETIEACRAPVAKPSPVAKNWIAEDPALKRSLDRLRAAPGILPVSEYA
jgi:predicted DNA-binding protein YlxM (UPF0122 family)